MKRVAYLLGVPFLLTGFASGQQTPVKSAAPPPTVTFRSDLLDLTFTYPGSLVAEKVPTPEEQHADTARKQPADEKPEYRKTDQCTDVALSAKRKDDPKQSTGTIAFYEGKPPQIALHEAVTGSILIARVGVSCMPTEYVAHLDEVVAGFALITVQGDDLKPIDQPLWYDVGKTRVHLAAAESEPDDPKAPKRWVVGTAFLSAGSLVTILFESNDLAFLNEMLHGKLTAGKEPAAVFFPAGIGNGTPLKPVP